MKKKLITLGLVSTLLVGCGSTKNIEPCCNEEPKKEVVSGENDPIMKLLLSGLIILSVNFLFTK
jgi:uncharacterized protein YcfL